MLDTWLDRPIESSVDGATITYKNGAKITIEDGKGATALVEAMIEDAKRTYISACEIIRTATDKESIMRAKIEKSRIEIWIRKSGIISLLADPDDVLQRFRRLAGC